MTSTPKHLSKSDWIAIKQGATERERSQLKVIGDDLIHKLTIESKLRTAGAKGRWFERFVDCGIKEMWTACCGCGKTKHVHARCNLRWCPLCNWRITDKRTELLRGITRSMTNLKHLVLTQRNFQRLTADKIKESTKALLTPRRRHVTSKVYGGCASLEFTNERNGFHMHWHLLVHARYVCAHCLSYNWGQLMKQEFAIVKVIPVHDESYLNEVCKYVVSGSELAQWKPHDIFELVVATQRRRLFTTFGTFREAKAIVSQNLEDERPPTMPCECGCYDKLYAPTESEVRHSYTHEYLRR